MEPSGSPTFESSPIDADQAFSGDVARVNYLAERLREEVERHSPVRSLCVPGCSGCARLYELYYALLKHLVAWGEATRGADEMVARTRSAFEGAIRRAFPKEARELESNPRVPRDLKSYEPETLGEVLVSFASQATQSNYEAGVRYGTAQLETCRDDIAQLERRLADAVASSLDVTAVRRAMGSALLGIPDPLVDQMLRGEMPLFAFLRELAGPAKARFELDGVTIEISVVAKGKGGQGHPKPSAPSAPDGGKTPSPQTAVVDKTDAASTPAGDEARVAAAPTGADARLGLPESSVSVPQAGLMTAEQMRRHLALRMTDGALFSLSRLKQAESGLGVDLGKGLIELEQGGMVELVRTIGGDALILPTDTFRSVVDAAGGEPSSAHQIWGSMRNLLQTADQRRAVAEALCPFLDRDYDLLRFDAERGGGAIWLTLSVPSSRGTGLGLLGCITSGGTHRLPHLPPYCGVVWMTGTEAHLKDAPSVPSGPAVYYGPAQQSGSDDVWFPLRPMEGAPMR